MHWDGRLCSPPGGEEHGCYFSGDCADGFVCETDNSTCAGSQPGKPCVNPALFLESSCAFGLWCDGELCQERKALGAPCNSDEECLTMRCGENFALIMFLLVISAKMISSRMLKVGVARRLRHACPDPL